MPVEIITKEDLQIFKTELLDDIKKLLDSSGKLESKKWLRSPEVRKLLGISPGTLQTLRINGTLPYSKIGSIIYYPYQDVIKAIEDNMSHNRK